MNKLSRAILSYCQNLKIVIHQQQEFRPPYTVRQFQFSSTILETAPTILNEHAPERVNRHYKGKTSDCEYKNDVRIN